MPFYAAAVRFYGGRLMRDTPHALTYQRERESERESVCVYVCVYNTCMYVRECARV